MWKEKAAQIKRDIPALFIAFKDPRTPWGPRALAFLTVAYALSPVDLVPDFIPVLGYLDDLLILPALAALAIKGIPAEVWAEARRQAGTLEPRARWYYALPVLALWAILLWAVLK